MIYFPTKMDQSVGSSSNSMYLPSLIILARSSNEFKLFLDSHSCDDLLCHATCCQVVVPSVAIQKHHGNVQADEKNDQIDGISKILVLLILHESDDSVDDHRITHVNEHVRHNTDT